MEILFTNTLCSSGRLSLIEKTCRREDGNTFQKPLLENPDAVIIIPFVDSETLVFIKNYRPSLDRYVWEFPAGTSEGEKNLLDCAKRELREETGYTASEWSHLFSFYPAVGISAYKMEVYKASNLTLNEQNLDIEESIEMHHIKIEDAYKMLHEGNIIDGKTQLLLYYLKAQG